MSKDAKDVGELGYRVLNDPDAPPSESTRLEPIDPIAQAKADRALHILRKEFLDAS